MMLYMEMLTVILTTLGFIVTFNLVSAKTYYVISTSNASCPTDETAPIGQTTTQCLTLTEYAQHLISEPISGPSADSNITLIFVPGHHALGSHLQIRNVANLSLLQFSYQTARQTDSAVPWQPTTMVTCSNSAGFTFEHISQVTVSDLLFSDCQENSVRHVDQLRMNDCSFENGHGIELRNVTNATIERSSFISLTVSYKSGGAISAFDSNLLLAECFFEQNTATYYGGAIWADDQYNIVNKRSALHSLYRGNQYNSNNIPDGGGAIFNRSRIISIRDCDFSSNRAIYGGAIVTMDCDLDINGSSFSNNTAAFGGAIHTLSSQHRLKVYGSTFSRNTAQYDGGAIDTVAGSSAVYSQNITIEGSNFTRNSAGGDGGAVFLGNTNSGKHGVNTITNCIFNDNEAANQGGALYVASNTFSFSGFLRITNNSATRGVVFALQSTLLLSGNTTISDNKASFFARGSNIMFDGHTNFMNNSETRDTSLKVEMGGALTSIQSDISFAGTVNFMYNTVPGGYGGAILLSESKIYTHGNTTIAHNTALSGGGIYAYQSELNFNGRTRITENVGAIKGGGVYAVGSAIRLTEGQLEFIENRAERGGGICLELDAKLYVIKAVAQCLYTDNPSCLVQPSLILYLNFTRNSAKYGGAMYISDDTISGTCAANIDSESSTSSECFFKDLAMHTVDYDDLIMRNTFFVENHANTSGNTVFGGLLDRCTVSPYAQVFNVKNQSKNNTNAISYLTSITDLQANNIQSEISSEPVRVCYCENNQPDCDNLQKTNSISVKKGETFNISLVAVDQVQNPVPSSVRAFLFSSLGGLAEGQDTQRVTTSNCTELNFTITSPRDSEQLVLYAEGPCSDTGISQTRLNVTFLPCICPIGFVKTPEHTNCSCECDPCLYPNYITGCSSQKSLLQRKDNVWISYINQTDNNFGDHQNKCQYLTYSHCPFDYCHRNLVWINLNTLTGSDAQCAFNRTGKLCGSCKEGLSLSLGSSRCMPCSNFWLALVIVFAIAGVALVAFLLVFNLTVAVGTINGLIFYANILTTNRSTFFPFQTPNFFTIFIAWLNLDFGFVTCFFDGMDAYAKEWLQLAFPIYIIILVTMVIIACEYSTRIAKLFTHTNPVATLDTLILLSYAKSLRVIIAALSQATLEYPDGLQERVWLINANICFLEGKHIPLFLVALLILLVGIVYTSLLFSYQWLLRCSNRRALKWIKNARFYPFMDAYLAPYNLKHRYWTGLLLLIRAFLYVIAALNISGDPRNNLLSIIITLLSLLLLKVLLPNWRIYKSWLIDALENTFIFNLIVFSVASLYIREAGMANQEALAYTSTTIAFITFLGILTYHTFAFVLPKKAQNKLESFKPKQLFTKQENKHHEIIHTHNKPCTYSVVAGIPPQHKLDWKNAAASKLGKEIIKTESTNSSDSSVITSQTTDENISTRTTSEQISKPDIVVVDDTGEDKIGLPQQKLGVVTIKLEPIRVNDVRLDPYIRDSDKLGMERESEIKDFIEVAT